MSDIPATYNADGAKKHIEPRSKLAFDSPDYLPPTTADIRAALALGELTGSQAGALLGVDGRTIRRWTGGEREMPFSAWRLLLALIGEITIKPIKKPS